MGKKKPARRGPSGVASPREKQGGQVEPVTDTVMQVIARRIRGARKKLQKVSVIEALLEENHTLNEDQVRLASGVERRLGQERVYMTKAPLTAIIEELLKLEPLVEAALRNELEEQVKTIREQWSRKPDDVTSSPAEAPPVMSETGDSEATTEGLSRPKTEEKDEAEGEISSENDLTIEAFDNAVEAMYFCQVRSKCDMM